MVDCDVEIVLLIPRKRADADYCMAYNICLCKLKPSMFEVLLMHYGKKISSLFLAAVLSFSFIGVPAFASEKATAEYETALDWDSRTTEVRSVEETIDFVYIDQTVLGLGDEQNIAFGLKEDAPIDGAFLVLRRNDNGTSLTFGATRIVENTALFTFSFEDESDVAAYELDAINYEAAGISVTVTFTEKQIVSVAVADDGEVVAGEARSGECRPYAFDVVGTALAEALENPIAAEGDIVAFAITEEGDLEAHATIEEALDCADEGAQAADGYHMALEEEASRAAQSDDSAFVSATLVKAVTSIGPEIAYAAADDIFVVGLDPGHGGNDPGAVGYGLEERDINWKIAVACRDELNSYHNVTAVLSREYDENPGLEERVDRLVAAGAKVVVSLHNNASGSGAGYGCEVWVPNDSSYLYQETHVAGEQLGQRILDKLGALGLTMRGVKTRDAIVEGYDYDDTHNPDGSIADYYTIIGQARRYGIPGIIVEHAFIDNASDASRLASDEFLWQLGIADAQGIAEQYGLVKQSEDDNYQIMGNSKTTPMQMASFFESKGYAYPASVYAQYGASSIYDFCRILFEEAVAEGVRAEVVFCQAMLETGWLQFGGSVNADQCNFCGLGATGGDNPGNSFNTYGDNSVRMGLRAQVQHLKAYASTASLSNPQIDPRFTYVTRGCAPRVDDLGGKWAADTGYGSKIRTLMDALLDHTQSISEATIATIPDCVYDGYAQEPALTVKLEGETLCADIDYVATYSDNIMPGTATVIVTGKGIYTGTISATFTIVARDLSEATISPVPDVVSTGVAQEIPLTVVCDNKFLKADTDYSVIYSNNIGPGTAIASVTGKGGYCGTISTAFNIVESDIDFDGMPYRIVSSFDDSYVLDVANQQPVEGSNVSAWTDNGGTNQLFTFEVVADGNVVFRNVANPNLVLDATGKNPEIGANVSAWTYNGGLNQEWSIHLSGNGCYTIANIANPRLVLDAAGDEPVRGANVSVWTFHDGKNQQWKFAEANDLAGASVNATGMVRNVIDGKAAAPVVVVTLNGKELAEGKDYELFYDDGDTVSKDVPTKAALYAVTAKAADGSGLVGEAKVGIYDLSESPAGIEEEGFFRIVSAANPDFILDVANQQPEKGSNVSIWASNGGDNQLFFIEPSDDGYYVLRSVANESLVLDAAGDVPELGSNVSTWTFKPESNMNQKWVFVSADDGAYNIVSAADSGLVLDAAGQEPEIGANVSLWESNGGKNQQWSIVSGLNLAYADVIVSGLVRNATGSALSPKVSVILNNNALFEGTDYIVKYNGSTDKPAAAGDYAVIIEGKAPFGGTYAVGEFTIYPAPVTQGSAAAYHLVSAFSDDFVLDVANQMPEKGSNVSIWNDNGGANQLFTLELGDDGYYVLRNVANLDLVLDAAGDEPVQGANVSAWLRKESGPDLNQKWILAESDARPGCYAVASAANPGLVLDAEGNEPVQGANVSVWTFHDGKNQLWSLSA